MISNLTEWAGDISQKQREVLAKYNQEPFTVIAIYACFSKARTEFGYDTILLKDVTDENKFPLCDHLWVKAPRYIPQGIEPGDSVKVFGRINLYTRADGSSDYTLFVFNLKKGLKEPEYIQIKLSFEKEKFITDEQIKEIRKELREKNRLLED